jgi:hypothetical protein
LQELDFLTVVAPKAEAVFQELCHTLQPYYMGHNAPLSASTAAEEETSSSGPGGAVAAAALQRLGPALEQLQQFGAKAALFLWLWFDQQCEAMAEQVGAVKCLNFVTLLHAVLCAAESAAMHVFCGCSCMSGSPAVCS